MQHYDDLKPQRKESPESSSPGVPSDLRPQLAEWIDVEEVGMDGFWLWLRTVLPLLPRRRGAPSGASSAEGSSSDRLRELSRELVNCGRERARLSVAADRYYRDNQILAVRLKALEATVRTFQRAGQGGALPADEEATKASERYLPRR